MQDDLVNCFIPFIDENSLLIYKFSWVKGHSPGI